MCDLDSAGNTRLTGSWPHTVLRERSPELTPGYLSGNPFRPRTVCLTEGLFSRAIRRRIVIYFISVPAPAFSPSVVKSRVARERKNERNQDLRHNYRLAAWRLSPKNAAVRFPSEFDSEVQSHRPRARGIPGRARRRPRCVCDLAPAAGVVQPQRA